ncbi:MAG: T9SS type A sorting domain-containing protein [Phycisphaerae bacterium]|nr:T9SS type A sorting domain-containing protein [Phycisphaerae bacterium]
MKGYLFYVASFMILLANPPTYAEQGAWVPIGPWGSNVRTLAIDPDNPQVIYAALSFDVLRSQNAGDSWELISNVRGLAPPHRVPIITDLEIDPSNSNHIIIATESLVARSLDGGTTWQVIIDSVGQGFYDIEFNPRNPNTVYAAAGDFTIEDNIDGGGIFKSVNGGQSWQLLINTIQGKDDHVLDIDIHPVDTTMLYAAVSVRVGSPIKADVYKSTDEAESWMRLNVASDEVSENPFDGSPFSISIAQSDPERMYVGMKDSVLVSMDGGLSWIDRTGNLPEGTNRLIVTDPRISECVYTGMIRQLPFRGFGLYKTEQGGVNWSKLTNGLRDSLINDIVFHPTQPDTLYIGTNVFGVYKSTDGGEDWNFSNGNMNFTGVLFGVDPNNLNTIYAANSGGIFRTQDGGSEWGRVFGLKENSFWNISVALTDSKIIYAAGRGRYLTIYRSQDGGDSWVSFSEIGGERLSTRVTDFKADPSDAEILYFSSFKGIYKSTHAAETWQTINEGLSTPWTDAIAINPLHSNTLYAGTQAGVFKSFNAGETWFKAGVDSFSASSLQIPVADTNMVFALSEGKILQSLDGGINWERVRDPDQGVVVGFAVDPRRPQTIWIGCRDPETFIDTIYRTQDGAKTWVSINEGLPSDGGIPVPYASPDANVLFAKTFGRGIYKLDLVVSVEESPKLPQNFHLFQNYPNPFNPTTTIEYELLNSVHVKLAIYNILGEEVITLVNKKQTAGRYRLTWDGKNTQGENVAVGIYLMRLHAGHFSQVRRMVLLR